jgi:hypothetical protein
MGHPTLFPSSGKIPEASGSFPYPYLSRSLKVAEIINKEKE